jgi:hypothetical protein
MKYLRTIFMGATLMLIVFFAASFAPLSNQADDGLVKWHKVTHDFGAIEKDKPVHTEFRFTNVTSYPIVITRVVASCGCTVPKYDETPIMPGREGVIKTSYTADAKGVFHKKITVLMDVGTYEIYVKGLVVQK